jgi:hypothetical protein
MGKTIVNGRRRCVKKGTWGRAIRRMDRQANKESLKDLKKTGRHPPPGFKRGISVAF